VNIIYKRDSPPRPTQRQAQRVVAEYTARFANPYVRPRGYIDDVIEPSQTGASWSAGLQLCLRKTVDRPRASREHPALGGIHTRGAAKPRRRLVVLPP